VVRNSLSSDANFGINLVFVAFAASHSVISAPDLQHPCFNRSTSSYGTLRYRGEWFVYITVDLLCQFPILHQPLNQTHTNTNPNPKNSNHPKWRPSSTPFINFPAPLACANLTQQEHRKLLVWVYPGRWLSSFQGGQQAYDTLFLPLLTSNNLTTRSEVAKDGNASVGTRFSAAGDAIGDKVDQHSHEVRLYSPRRGKRTVANTQWIDKGGSPQGSCKALDWDRGYLLGGHLVRWLYFIDWASMGTRCYNRNNWWYQLSEHLVWIA
jgi:hypothetical protein